MVRINTVTGKPHGPEAHVFGDATRKVVASPKKAWEVCGLKAHGHKPQWRNGANGLSKESRALLATVNLHWPDLRHEAVSQWAQAGWLLHHIQRMLGHGNVKQTSTYLNAATNEIEARMRRTDELRGFSSSGTPSKAPAEIPADTPA